jgi:hypothetical protein
VSRRRVRPRQTPPPDWTIVDGHEPSAWLRTTAAARLRAIAADRQVLAVAPAIGLIVCPLGRSGRPGSREDFTCDRCRRYCGAPADEFHVFGLQFRPVEPGLPDVMLTGGLCADCAAREGGLS